MKKILCLALVLVMVFAFVGCKKDPTVPDESTVVQPGEEVSPETDVVESEEPGEDLDKEPGDTTESGKPVEESGETTDPEVPGEIPEKEKPTDAISGSSESILQSVISDANGILGEENGMGMSFDSEVTEDTAQNSLGISSEQFSQYVTEAYVSTAAISAHAHQVAVVKCKDAAAALEVKKLVASGFDSGKWICVYPEQSFAVESGSYVLMAATRNDVAAALKSSFSALAGGKVGTVNVFYTFQ